MEVLSLVRSVKNSFVPVNRIPPEILSLTPDYYDEDDVDQGLITLTHVCRSWRDAFISRSSLWTRLDFTNVDKTRAYIHRSKSFPLEIYLEKNQNNSYLDDAFFLVIPHIHRVKSLVIRAKDLSDTIKHFYHHVPLLEKLDIRLTHHHAPIFNTRIFKGDLSSLCKLSLGGVITCLPCNNLANLTTFKLKSSPPGLCSITRLLNFFKHSPLLHTIDLKDSIPMSSNAPPGQTVSLPYLRLLAISAQPPHSTLLNHLLIPAGASLVLGFTFGGGKSPLRNYLPENTANLKNLSHITTISLQFDTTQKYVQMSGPSGNLCVLAHWEDEIISPHTMDRRIMCSINQDIFSTTRRLAISKYKPPRPAQVEECPVFQTLTSMNNLHTLILARCYNLPFILALNPNKNSSRLVLCPDLETIILYIKSWDQFHIKHLLSMANRRDSSGVKLSSITIVGLGELVPGKEVLKLREYVTRVDYRIDDIPPDWYDLLNKSSDEAE